MFTSMKTFGGGEVGRIWIVVGFEAERTGQSPGLHLDTSHMKQPDITGVKCKDVKEVQRE